VIVVDDVLSWMFLVTRMTMKMVVVVVFAPAVAELVYIVVRIIYLVAVVVSFRHFMELQIYFFSRTTNGIKMLQRGNFEYFQGIPPQGNREII
tara:strand:+ start:192 stop:470 length:279 start_codon:yes stop_codon:yes gene_type:complete